jgi:hypothetical protein
MKTVQFDTFHNNYVFHNWLVEFSFFCLSLFLEIRLKHAWPVYLVLSDVLCTFGCTLYFHFWKYKVLPKVHRCGGINIFSTGNRKRVQSTSESTFMYFRMYFVLSIVLCTFKCTLKSTRCTFDNVRKHDLTFSKNQKRLLCTCNFLYEY